MNILIIAPYYAPSSEVPSVRMISLSQYLINQGHSVTVMCYSEKMLLTMYKREELRSKIPNGVKVIGFDIEGKRYPYISDIIDGMKFSKILPQMVDLTLFDVVFTTCGPYFTLKEMPEIADKYNVPYILDFRDLGALNYRPHLRTERKKVPLWKKPILSWYLHSIKNRERKAVEFASKIICVSEIDKEKMQTAYGIPDRKCMIATNGFDDAKLAGIVPKKKQNSLVGAVFGKFMYYSVERAMALLKAIDDERKNGVEIKLLHIGRPYEWISEAIEKNDIDSLSYDSVGLKEYSEGMSLLGSADFFVVEDTSPDDVGTKIYDYIYWNKPIIASVSKDIPLACLVGTFEHGYVCETKEEVSAALKDIIRNNFTTLDSKIDVMKFSRSFQNQKMEQAMKEIVEG